MSCCSGACSAIESHFDASVARRELDSYRKKGPGVTTRLLRDGLTEVAQMGGTLLDIGAGIGALTLELLEHGIQRAVSVDASSAFVSAGREETLRRNRAGQVEWVHGDFVALAETLPEADVVTLDRVVCCYPRFEPLLAGAARHIGLGVGLFLSYLAAATPDPQGKHHYYEIMLPGAILGAIVGFATQRYGAGKERTA